MQRIDNSVPHGPARVLHTGEGGPEEGRGARKPAFDGRPIPSRVLKYCGFHSRTTWHVIVHDPRDGKMLGFRCDEPAVDTGKCNGFVIHVHQKAGVTE